MDKSWLWWAVGILTGLAWMLVNLVLMNNLFKVAFLKGSKKKLILLLLIKFPLLYAVLLAVLLSKKFPIAAILVGMPLAFIAQRIARICRKRT